MPYERFGILLERLLAERGVSIPGFARAVNLSRAHVDHVVRGRRKPPTDRLDIWADVLKLRGQAREEFITSALLEHTPPVIRDRYLAMEKRLELK